jgi:hypothetical protein
LVDAGEWICRDSGRIVFADSFVPGSELVIKRVPGFAISRRGKLCEGVVDEFRIEDERELFACDDADNRFSRGRIGIDWSGNWMIEAIERLVRGRDVDWEFFACNWSTVVLDCADGWRIWLAKGCEKLGFAHIAGGIADSKSDIFRSKSLFLGFVIQINNSISFDSP